MAGGCRKRLSLPPKLGRLGGIPLKNLGTVLALTLAFAALAALAPTAAAYQQVCHDDLCLRAGSGVEGDGSCEATSSWRYEATRVDLTYQDGSTFHGAYVENYCFASNFDGYEESGSGLGAGYQTWDYDAGNFAALRAGWYSYSWAWGGLSGTDCAVVLYSYNMGAVPDLHEREACPLEQSAPLLPLPPL